LHKNVPAQGKNVRWFCLDKNFRACLIKNFNSFQNQEDSSRYEKDFSTKQYQKSTHSRVSCQNADKGRNQRLETKKSEGPKAIGRLAHACHT